MTRCMTPAAIGRRGHAMERKGIECFTAAPSQHQHASGVGMPNQIAEDPTGMLLIVPCLGAALGMGPSVNTGDAAPYVVGSLTGQRLGYTVDAAHGWG